MGINKVKILKTYEPKEIEEKINKFLKKGYKIHGDLIVTPDKDFFIVLSK